MFTSLNKAPYDPVPQVRITRDQTDKGWIVHGAHPQIFLDSQYEGSRNNSYVAAVAYSESMVSKSKRAWSTDRNFVLLEKQDRAKQLRLYVRITRPTGGYKFFMVARTTITGEFMSATHEEVRVAVSQAVAWFIQERDKCQDVITSKNIAAKNKRSSQRRSLLFGEFIP
jgi:sarcosine oxidase delta subunit